MRSLWHLSNPADLNQIPVIYWFLGLQRILMTPFSPHPLHSQERRAGLEVADPRMLLGVSLWC